MTAIDVCNSQNDVVMNILRMESQIKQLEFRLKRLALFEPVLGTEAHTVWHAQFCELQDTLWAVQSCLGLDRRAQKKAQKEVGA